VKHRVPAVGEQRRAGVEAVVEEGLVDLEDGRVALAFLVSESESSAAVSTARRAPSLVNLACRALTSRSKGRATAPVRVSITRTSAWEDET
jgi:hypothetical protein